MQGAASRRGDAYSLGSGPSAEPPPRAVPPIPGTLTTAERSPACPPWVSNPGVGRLNSVAPKLRPESAGAVIIALLDDVALTAAGGVGRMSERALRRLFDRLVRFAVRELSGRKTCRLCGL